MTEEIEKPKKQKKPPKPLAPPPAWLPPDWKVADAAAWQAIHRGDAGAWQQQRALKWLLDFVAETGGLSYRVDPLETAFCEGRRFVGLQIVKLIKLNLQEFKDKE